MADKKETVSPSSADHRENLEPGFTYNELLKQLESEIKLDKYDPEFDVTITDIMIATGRGDRNCRDILDMKVRQGLLKKHFVRRDGEKILAFYDPSKYNPNKKE